MERVKLDIWVGIFVALGIIAMFYMATRVGNLTSNDVKETYEVKAYFENIGGLKPRADFKLTSSPPASKDKYCSPNKPAV